MCKGFEETNSNHPGLGKIILAWAGDTMKQRLVSAAAARSSGNDAFLGAGADLAERLVDAIGT